MKKLEERIDNTMRFFWICESCGKRKYDESE